MKIIILVAIAVLLSHMANAQVNVSGAQLANGNYSSLSSAFNAINNNGNQAGNDIVISITGNTVETSVAELNQPAQSWNSFIIRPEGGSARTISGTIAPGNALINLNGADNVIIDGLNNGGNSLTIINTTVSSTEGTSTIRFINGASNNTIINCTILGSSTAEAGFAIPNAAGTIFFSTDSNTPNGNDNNTISNCNIGPVGMNLPSKGIFSLGSTSSPSIFNSGNTISNCNIYDYFSTTVASSGILIVDGNEGWTITNNKLYQTSAKTQTSGANHTAIRVDWSLSSNSGYGFIIDNNTIGFNSSNATGNYTINGVNGTRFFGIHASFTTDVSKPLSSVSNNSISNITMSGSLSGTVGTSPFIGIYSSNGQINMNGNTIGSLTTSGLIPNNNNIVISSSFSTNSSNAIEIYGIFRIGSSNQLLTTNNNSIGGFSFTGNNGGRSIIAMRCSGSTGSIWECRNNIIGSDGGTSFNASSNFASTASTVTGIHSNMPNAIIMDNVIRSMINAGGTGTGLTLLSPHAICGINIATNTEQLIVEGNTVNRLIQASISNVGSVICGISIGATSSNSIIRRNFVHGLSNYANSTNASIIGIRTVNSGTNTIENNMVQVGIMFNGDGQPNSHATITGILESGGINNFYHNSVFVGGENIVSTGTPAPTFAFRSTVSNSSSNIINNIFYNARSNGTGTSNHYAVSLATSFSINMNYNILLANGNGGIVGISNNINSIDLISWQTSTNLDLNSYELDPKFINPSGNVYEVDLHIQAFPTPTPVEGNGFAINTILNDYDDEIRNSLSPVDIGADAGNFASITQGNDCLSQYQTTTSNCNIANFYVQSLVASNSYSWDFGDGSISSLPQPNHVFLSPGNFTVCLTVSGPNCNTTQNCNTIVIEDPSQINIQINPSGPVNLCPNESVLLVATSNLSNYLWNNNETTSSIQVNSNGSYSVIGFTDNGCSISSNTVNVSVDTTGGIGSISLTADNNFICQNESITLIASEEFQNYTWSNGMIGSSNIIITEPGSYSVSAFTFNNCPATSATIAIGLVPEIESNITYVQLNNFEVQFNSNSQNATSFLWNFGDGTTSTLENPIHNYPIEDTYSVSLTLSNDCQTITINEQVSIVKLSLYEFTSNYINIFPNPTSGLLFFELSNRYEQNAEIQIYNNLGQIVLAGELNTLDQSKFDLSTYKNGVYHLVLTIPEKKTYLSKRFILQK